MELLLASVKPGYMAQASTYIVVHVCSAQGPYGHIVGELDLVDIRAVGFDMGTIVNSVVLVHQPNTPDPIPDHFDMLSVTIVASVPGETCTNIEEAAIGNGVLVIITSEVRIDLPTQSTDISQRAEARGIIRTHPPPHVLSGLTAWVLKTACANESHDGWFGGGF